MVFCLRAVSTTTNTTTMLSVQSGWLRTLTIVTNTLSGASSSNILVRLYVLRNIYSTVLDIKGSLFLLRRQLLSKYESETSVLVSDIAEYMDVSLLFSKLILVEKPELHN